MRILDYLNLPEGEMIPSAIVIHHSLSSSSTTVDDIDRWHREKGWRYVGYAEVIEADGDVWLCRKNRVQAANYKYNTITYNICLCGNFDTNNYVPSEQWKSLVTRVKQLKEKYPNAVIKMHRHYGNTENCPGKNFPFQKLLEEVKKVDKVDKSWKEILREVSTDPDKWVEVIELLSNIKESDSILDLYDTLGDLYIHRDTLRYLPLLIEKIYNK